MRCPRCGKENENEPFCVICGEELPERRAGVSDAYMPAHPHDVRAGEFPVYERDDAYERGDSYEGDDYGDYRRTYSRYRSGPERTRGIAAVAAMTLLFAAIGLAVNVASLLFLRDAGGSSSYPGLVTPLLAVAAACIVVDGACVAAAYGLWNLEGWGWVLAIFMNLAGILLSIPGLVLTERVTGQSSTLLLAGFGADVVLALAILFYLFQNRVMLLYE